MDKTADERKRENNRLRQRKFLELHKEEINEKRRERYQERLSLGKCPRCGGKTKKGRALCADCCDYMLNLNRKYASQKQSAVKKAAPKKAAEKKTTPKKAAPKKAVEKKASPKKAAPRKTAEKKAPVKKAAAKKQG